MNNMEIYEQAREVPNTAKRAISGGKLKGKTDINPMWRIKKLTELFGPCGIGWYTEPVREEIRELENGEVVYLIDINLYIKCGDDWSKPIFGTGGSMILQFEKGNLVSNDEGKKMAYTDAISVACKALGFAADVYFERDTSSKYARENEDEQPQTAAKAQPVPDYVKANANYCSVIAKAKNISAAEVMEKAIETAGTDAPEAVCKVLCAWMRKVKQQ